MKNREGMQYNIHVNEEKGVIAVRIMNGVSQLANEFAMFCQKNNTYFDGDGHTIDGLYFNGSQKRFGLFSYVGDSLIKNLKISNAYINNTVLIYPLKFGSNLLLSAIMAAVFFKEKINILIG